MVKVTYAGHLKKGDFIIRTSNCIVNKKIIKIKRYITKVNFGNVQLVFGINDSQNLTINSMVTIQTRS